MPDLRQAGSRLLDQRRRQSHPLPSRHPVASPATSSRRDHRTCRSDLAVQGPQRQPARAGKGVLLTRVESQDALPPAEKKIQVDQVLALMRDELGDAQSSTSDPEVFIAVVRSLSEEISKLYLFLTRGKWNWPKQLAEDTFNTLTGLPLRSGDGLSLEPEGRPSNGGTLESTGPMAIRHRRRHHGSLHEAVRGGGDPTSVRARLPTTAGVSPSGVAVHGQNRTESRSFQR